MSSSTPTITSESIPVQEMSIQWLDFRRTRRCLDWEEKKIQATPLGDIVKAIVELYNKNHDKARPFKHHPKFTPKEENDLYKVELFTRKIRHKPQLATQVKKLGAERKKLEGKKTGDEFLFFFCAKTTLSGKRREVVVLSTGQGYSAVQQCRRVDAPTKIAEKILDPSQITEIRRYCLVGSMTKEVLIDPGPNLLYKTSSLYYLVEKIEGIIKANASLLSIPPFSGSNSSRRMSITSAGLLRIHTPISLDNYSRILILFHYYLQGMETFSSQAEIEKADPRFEFLHFLKSATVFKAKLDGQLLKVLYERSQKEEPLDISFRHTYLDQYFHSHQFQIQKKKGGTFRDFATSPPTLEEVVDAVVNEEDSLSESDFKKAFGEQKLRFFNVKDQGYTEAPLVDYLEGEISYGGKRYFKVRAMWHQLSADFHALTQEDFRTLLRRTFLKADHEASLPLPWRGNSEGNLLKEDDVKKIFGFKKGIRKFMKTLETTKVQFVSSKGEVNQVRLVGEILKVPEVSKHKDAIEKMLAAKTVSKEDIKKAFKEDGEKIFAELQVKRDFLKVIQKKSGGKERSVKNPLTYPFKEELKEREGEFAAFLEGLYTSQKETEADYNRSYLYNNTNGGKPFGPKRGYLVFDQITPLNIEYCDLMFWIGNILYLYHVKETFGQHTRDVCSQILNGARQLRSALSSHHLGNYLELLWEKGLKTASQEDWLKLVKKQLQHLGKENFLNLFRNRRIVFVYAYLGTPGKSFEEESATPTQLSQQDLPSLAGNSEAWEALEKSRYLDSKGRLTGGFYESSQKTFKIEGFEDESRQVYQDLTRFRSVSESTLAKLDLLHLAKELEALNFELKICEIQRTDTPLPPLASLPPTESEEDPFSVEESESVNLPVEVEDDVRDGFVNLGNSCFINAVLQMFSHLEPLKKSAETKKETPGMPLFLSQALVKRDRPSLFQLRETLYSPDDLINFPPKEKLQQQDAHEFLTFMLGKLQWFPLKAYTLIFKTPPEKQSENSTNHLSIPITAGKGFQELIQDYFKKEKPEGYSHPIAQRIKGFPELLIIQLKRFDNFSNKIKSSIDFPKNGKVFLQQRRKDPKTDYEVVGLINHHGSTIKFGHYTADVIDENGRWLHCDDRHITVANPKDPGKDAYIIFLKKCK